MVSILLLGTAARSAAAQDARVVWPETVAGGWAAEFFTALNAGTRDSMLAFVARRYRTGDLSPDSIDRIASGLRGIHGQLGLVRIHSITADGRYAVSVLSHSATLALWIRFQIRLDSVPPHDLITLAGRPASAPTDSIVAYAGWATLDELPATARRDAGAPGMVIGVVRAGQQEVGASGSRHLGSSASVERDDAFHIGSVTKAFTATLLGRLIERGVLRWDETVGEVFPEAAMQPQYRAVTLELLLQHRSGVPTLPESLLQRAAAPRSPTAGRAALAGRPLDTAVSVEFLQEAAPSGGRRSPRLERTFASVVELVTGARPPIVVCPALLETRFYEAAGVAALAYGPGGLEEAHGPNESVAIEELVHCAAVYPLAARHLATDPRQGGD